MSITRQDETELLTALHEGPLETSPWSIFLERLRRRLRADHATLLLARADSAGSPAIELHPAERFPDVTPPPLLATLYRLDAASFARLRPSRVYSQDDLIEPIDARRKSGAPAYLRIVRASVPENATCWLAVGRSGRNFEAADGAVLVALAAHLTIALRTFVAIQRTELRAATMDAALAQLGCGWLALDAKGQVVEQTPMGRMLLDAARSAGSDPARQGWPATAARAHLLASPVRNPVLTAATGAVETAFLRGERPLSAASPDMLVRLWGLTNSEARLACALANGQTLAEAGAALGLTEETARNYSKRIYAKTGRRGQADLVRAILTSAAALA